MFLVSYEFVIFICLAIIIYYILPKRFQWIFLLLTSLVFYISGGLYSLLLIGTTIISIFFVALMTDKINTAYTTKVYKDKESKKAAKKEAVKKKRLLLLIGIILNFGILAVLKYTNFTIGNINSLLHFFGSTQQIGYVNFILPLGISYYTFQSVGYLIDIYRNKYPAEKNLAKYALFVTFFPQLVEGPICRFDETGKQLSEGHAFESDRLWRGLIRALWGYAKKLVIADRLTTAVAVIGQDPSTYSGAYVLLGMIIFTIYLYADFTGGIDIVIGIAQMFGINMPENFNRPYFSKKISEYWTRWHMSLMRWFREYIFYPMCVCGLVKSISRAVRKRFGDSIGRRIPLYLSSITVWFITGMWHASNWNYVIWGMSNCVIVLVSGELEPLYKRFHKRFNIKKSSIAYKSFCIVRTMLIISALQIFAYYKSAAAAIKAFVNMITGFSAAGLLDERITTLGIDFKDTILIVVGIIIMFSVSMTGRRQRVTERLHTWRVRYMTVCILAVSIIVFGTYGLGYDASQFIYTQF